MASTAMAEVRSNRDIPARVVTVTITRARRRDALPEHLTYHDDGCEVAPRCLACPLERCRYEEPNGIRTVRVRERAADIRALQREGLTNAGVMARMGITRRTLYRTLEVVR